MTLKGVRERFIVGSRDKNKNNKKKKEINLGLNWVLQIKGVGRDSDRQRR